ncbi:hypothetical protein NPIL_522471 [Nephila pilipes]|uniref:C2H2-type domain-containing protein n=1 Tax=Nephila pilipes TaxID=299642 RepID=A0A8X6T651_NEPPI|nr:hypothetical protein NPIL_522471 [Nephila pilipes]
MVSCNVCGKCFNTNYNLKRHTLQVHEKKYSHQCPDCSKKFAQPSDLKRHKDSVHSAEKIVCEFCGTSFTRRDNLLHHLNNGNCQRKLQKEAGKRKRLDLTISSRKKKSQLSTSAENSAAVLENSTTVSENSDDDLEKISLPPKESESAFQKAYKSFNLPNNDSSLGIKEFLLLRKEETVFIFRNELKTYKSLKVSKWVHCIYSKETDAGKMIKNVEFKTSNNEVFQETNLVSLYDTMSEKIKLVLLSEGDSLERIVPSVQPGEHEITDRLVRVVGVGVRAQNRPRNIERTFLPMTLICLSFQPICFAPD